MGKRFLVLLVVAVCAMALVMPIHAEDIIKNGTFDTNTDNWVYWAGGGGECSTPAVENGECKIKIFSVGNETWTVQFRQDFMPVVKGQTYVIKFDARSSTPRKIRWILEKNGGAQPYPVYMGPQDVELTTEMQTFTFEGVSEGTEANAHLVFCLGVLGRIGKPHTIWFDNISVTTK